MANRIQFLLLTGVVALGLGLVDGPFAHSPMARAQDSGRGSSDSDRHHGSRDWRGRSSGGSDHGGDHGSDRSSDRGRDSRGGRRDDERRGDDRSSSGSSSGGSNSSTAKPTTTTPAASSTTTATKPATDSKTSTSTGASASTRAWATSFIKEHDKNGNGWLDGDEIKDYHGKANAIDKDGVITVDSLMASASGTAAPTAAAATASSGTGSADATKGGADLSKRVLYGTAGGLAANSKEGDKRHSYRFTPATERPSMALSGKFKAMDANGDGQVEMSEYSHSWSKSTAEEFRRYDTNDDGVISAKEAAGKSTTGG